METLLHCPNGREHHVRQFPEKVQAGSMGYHSSPEDPNLKGLEDGGREWRELLIFNSLDDYDS